MRTAIDTNVLSALWSKEDMASQLEKRLGEARNEGGLVIGPPVYAELLAHPRATESFVNNFLADTDIAIDFDFERPVWIDAGRRFAQYAVRRQRAGGEDPRRLLTDFLIGAHALAQADRLMTLDPKRYQRDFPELRFV
jgi:predicted nucleic acid-binding protein